MRTVGGREIGEGEREHFNGSNASTFPSGDQSNLGETNTTKEQIARDYTERQW